jgi:hypothetical protein
MRWVTFSQSIGQYRFRSKKKTKKKKGHWETTGLGGSGRMAYGFESLQTGSHLKTTGLSALDDLKTVDEDVPCWCGSPYTNPGVGLSSDA